MQRVRFLRSVFTNYEYGSWINEIKSFLFMVRPKYKSLYCQLYTILQLALIEAIRRKSNNCDDDGLEKTKI